MKTEKHTDRTDKIRAKALVASHEPFDAVLVKAEVLVEMSIGTQSQLTE